MSSISQAQRAKTPTVEGRSAGYVPPSRNFCHDSEINANFRWYYHRAMEPHASRWDKRAAGIKKGNGGSLKYATDRARSLRLDPFDRLEHCGKRKTVIKCGCRYVRVPVACGMRWLCPECQRRANRKTFKRLRRAMSMHSKAARAKWSAEGSQKRQERKWSLVTLTTRHSGDLSADRATLIQGWKRFRQWAWGRFGRFAFALIWELTPGDDGRGHLHAHVACLWPWVDYSEVRAEWLRATGGESQRISIVAGRKGPGGVAHYLAKYASKGVDLSEIDAKLGAAVIAANYGQRLVTTSHRFWRPREPHCPTCKKPFVLYKRPRPLSHSAAFAVWDATARGRGVDCARDPPQVLLPWPSPPPTK
jgi:hypothetical protein